MKFLPLIIAAVLTLTLSLPVPVGAAPLSPEKCNALKEKELGKLFFGIMNAYSKALKKGAEPSFTKGKAKFAAKIQKLTLKCGDNLDGAIIAQMQAYLESVSEQLARSVEAGSPAVSAPSAGEFAVAPVSLNAHTAAVELAGVEFPVEFQAVRLLFNTSTPTHEAAPLAVQYFADVAGEARSITYAFSDISGDRTVVARIIPVGIPDGETHLVDRTVFHNDHGLIGGSFRAGDDDCEVYLGEFVENGDPAKRAVCPDGSSDPRSAALLLANAIADPVIGAGDIAQDSGGALKRGISEWFSEWLAWARDWPVPAMYDSLKTERTEETKTTSSYTCAGISEELGLFVTSCEGVMCNGVCCLGTCTVTQATETVAVYQ